MTKNDRIRNFFLPKFSVKYATRVTIISIFAWFFFSSILIPIKIDGISMEPAYEDGGFNFIIKPYYTFAGLKRHDVVGVRLAGKHVMLLKRIVGLEGETVEFRKGILFINGNSVVEHYVVYPCDWDLSPRKVGKGKVYLVGDNRNMPKNNHVFGQTSVDRIMGVPLW